MIQTSKALIENSDSVYERLLQTQRLEHSVRGSAVMMAQDDEEVFVMSKVAMEYHENLHDLAVKEGLKGRKQQKALESFTWNITILK
ncbi:hypothetical protein JZ751_009730, partial [Albula glossodonta]